MCKYSWSAEDIVSYFMFSEHTVLPIILTNVNWSVSGPAQVVSRMLTKAVGDGRKDISSMISEGRIGHQEGK